MRNQNVTSDYRREQMRAYNKANMEKILKYQSEYKKNKLKTDPLYRLEGMLRRMINSYMRKGGWSKKSKINQIVGLSYEEYVKYIESTWTKGMSWENYGRHKDCWNIDHIIAPVNSETEEEILAKFHYTNTRAIWHVDNVKKSNFQKPDQK